MERVRRKAALGIFALLVTAAPLLFGAVDRQIQIGLTLLLGIGLILVRPAVPQLTAREKQFIGLWLALIVFKEFAPYTWFGGTKWHNILSQDYELKFPWTHNPEPGRAFDALLVITMGAIWFIWVRTLASETDDRPLMIWILFGAATVLAVVCLTVHPKNPQAIYGMRFTPGWTGYGPFPNRNHTACFLAMGTLLGCGCITNAVRHRKQLQTVLSFVFLLLVSIALLQSKSRGGLSTMVAGLCIYGALLVFKLRNRRAVIAVLSGGLFFGILFLAFGTHVLSRFNATGEGEISADFRWAVWANAITMWRDAPVFGHGLASFAQLFPIYETLKLENQIVLHPESSWLLCLVEIGALPVLIAVVAGAVFIARHLKVALGKSQGFFLRSCGFAAVAVIVFHSVMDVPAHRWATAGYALAILAIVCPMQPRKEKVLVKSKMALIPFAVAGFWLLPFVANFPAWTPSYLTNLLSKDENLMSAAEIGHELDYFPLSPNLHQALGMRLLSDYKDTRSAWRHFRIADRLVPSSWPLAVAQALASRQFSTGMMFHFWSLAIERAGHRSEDLFYMAYDHTARLPAAAPFWNSYVESNPELLLSYCQRVPDANANYYFQLWWKNRAFAGDVKEFEIRNFYNQAPKHGNLANIYEWMAHYPAREKTDFKAWAALLHHWHDDATAWKLFSHWVKEPEYPVVNSSASEETLEAAWFTDPGNILDAQLLAQIYTNRGDMAKAGQVILAVAAQENAPLWFLQKAAYVEAGQGRYDAAVATLLRQ